MEILVLTLTACILWSGVRWATSRKLEAVLCPVRKRKRRKNA
jgi:hypothetical protein